MRRIALLCFCILLAACGGGSSTTTTKPTPKPTPTPTLAPDNDTISIAAQGLGEYQLISIPVAVITSHATRSAAMGVVVHFTVQRNGANVYELETPAIQLGPGQTLAVAADCTDPCTHATGVTATVSAQTWETVTSAKPFPALTAGTATVTGGTGRGQADATATITGSHIAKQALLNGFAACYNAQGTVIGGGLSTFSWKGTGSQSLTVPVIVSAAIAHCDVYAAVGS